MTRCIYPWARCLISTAKLDLSTQDRMNKHPSLKNGERKGFGLEKAKQIQKRVRLLRSNIDTGWVRMRDTGGTEGLVSELCRQIAIVPLPPLRESPMGIPLGRIRLNCMVGCKLLPSWIFPGYQDPIRYICARGCRWLSYSAISGTELPFWEYIWCQWNESCDWEDSTMISVRYPADTCDESSLQ
jgi:hypothetical protein